MTPEHALIHKHTEVASLNYPRCIIKKPTKVYENFALKFIFCLLQKEFTAY